LDILGGIAAAVARIGLDLPEDCAAVAVVDDAATRRPLGGGSRNGLWSRIEAEPMSIIGRCGSLDLPEPSHVRTVAYNGGCHTGIAVVLARLVCREDQVHFFRSLEEN